jgi:hypothetical protein
VVEIERKAVYRFHGLVAKQWRKGPVMLAGDAAHQMPPFAGQGMCSGIRDAANLSWKLEAIVKGGSPDTLLDSYQPECEPSVRAYIGLAIGMGQVVCILDEAAAAQRDAGMIAMPDAGGEARYACSVQRRSRSLWRALPKRGGVRRFPELVPTSTDSPGSEHGRAGRDWFRDHWSGQSFMAIGAADPVITPPAMHAFAPTSGAARNRW